MPLFTIRRPFPGATRSDLDAAAWRSINCIPFYPGMRWVRSYYDADREETLCVYEARSEADLRRHAVQAHLPLAEVRPVEEVLPDELMGTARPEEALA